ncbi:PH domain-containing protein [Marinactinospora rubrisoli]|uniref:PH domain-containing protein n=1 Tax=Marinactinospora rubrisoli TaxID=2715399 RepID=A0ABW2KM85_9ACTN
MTADTAPWRPLSARSVLAATLLLAVAIGVPALVTTVVLAVFWSVLGGLAVAAGGVLLVAALTGGEWVRVRRTRYRLTAERLELRAGLLSETLRSVPRDRIRSVDVSADIVSRLLGVRTVTVGTGDGGGADAGLPLRSLDAPGAEELRRVLLDRGAAPAGAAPGEGAIARLDARWFGYAPLAEWAPLLGLGVYGGLYSVLTWFGEERAGRGAAAVDDLARPHLVVAVPAALLVVLLTGMVAALLGTVEAWWGYRLDREGDGSLRLRRGLFTTTSISLEQARLRGVELCEPLPARWFRGARLRAIATGLGTAGDDRQQVARDALGQALALAVAHRVAAGVLLAQRSPFAAAPLRAHPAAARRRRLSRAVTAAVVTAAATAAAVVAVPALPAWAWLAPVAVLAGALPWAHAAYRALGHALTGEYLLVRSGGLFRRTAAVRRDGVIGWRITRSPFQRRAGLATVGATTAAGAGVYRAADVDLATGLAFADDAVPGLLSPFLIRR